MLKKVLATLIASAFATAVFAQAQPAEPKGVTGATTQKAEPAKKHAKAQKKDRHQKPAKAKGEAKSEAGK